MQTLPLTLVRRTNIEGVRSEVLTVVMMVVLFWCQAALKMEYVCLCETLKFTYVSTRRQNPEEHAVLGVFDKKMLGGKLAFTKSK
jgi:hypothetical protein